MLDKQQDDIGKMIEGTALIATGMGGVTIMHKIAEQGYFRIEQHNQMPEISVLIQEMAKAVGALSIEAVCLVSAGALVYGIYKTGLGAFGINSYDFPPSIPPYTRKQKTHRRHIL